MANPLRYLQSVGQGQAWNPNAQYALDNMLNQQDSALKGAAGYNNASHWKGKAMEVGALMLYEDLFAKQKKALDEANPYGRFSPKGREWQAGRDAQSNGSSLPGWAMTSAPQVSLSGTVDQGLGQEDYRSMLTGLQGLAEGYTGPQSQALRAQGLQRNQQDMMSSTRTLNAQLGANNIGGASAAGQRASLLRQGSVNNANLNRDLIVSNISSQQNALNLLNQAISGDIGRQQNAQYQNNYLSYLTQQANASNAVELQKAMAMLAQTQMQGSNQLAGIGAQTQGNKELAMFSGLFGGK